MCISAAMVGWVILGSIIGTVIGILAVVVILEESGRD